MDYLRLFAGSDYARPLARDRAVALPLLDEVAGASGADAAVAMAAELRDSMLGDADAGGRASHRPLSDRELDVLARLESHKDKEIAGLLNLSHDGVRYRVRSIFAKLGAHSRRDAVRRARAQGILPPAGDAREAGS